MRSMCWTVLLRIPGQHPASSPKNGRLAPWPELASQGSGARPEKVMETQRNCTSRTGPSLPKTHIFMEGANTKPYLKIEYDWKQVKTATELVGMTKRTLSPARLVRGQLCREGCNGKRGAVPRAKNQVQREPETRRRGWALTAHKGPRPDGPGQGPLRRGCAEPRQGGQTRAVAPALNPHAGRPPAPAQPCRPPPVSSDGVLLSVLLPTWFLLSERAGAPPAPATSPAECGSWR